MGWTSFPETLPNYTSTAELETRNLDADDEFSQTESQPILLEPIVRRTWRPKWARKRPKIHSLNFHCLHKCFTIRGILRSLILAVVFLTGSIFTL
jgi:hypothetical protein